MITKVVKNHMFTWPSGRQISRADVQRMQNPDATADHIFLIGEHHPQYQQTISRGLIPYAI